MQTFANHQVSPVSPNSFHFSTNFAEATFLLDMWDGCPTVGFSGTPNNGTPHPYYSHTTPIRIPKDMGVV